MATFVLVPGAWLGGWVWRPVAQRLRAAGHEVYPVTLTGLGERSHLAAPAVNLDTHITDIANVITYEDLTDVLLVGHSYGGVPITGVAGRVPDRLRRLIYLDCTPIPDGTAFLDVFGPEERAFHERRAAEQGDGWRLPVFTWEELETVNGASLDGLDAAARAWMQAHATAQPFGTYTQPLHVDDARATELPKTAILNEFPLDQLRAWIAAGHPLAQLFTSPGWTFSELPTGHWSMVSRPDDLADLLGAIADGEPGVAL